MKMNLEINVHTRSQKKEYAIKQQYRHISKLPKWYKVKCFIKSYGNEAMIKCILSSIIDVINSVFEKQLESIHKKFLLQINTSVNHF